MIKKEERGTFWHGHKLGGRVSKGTLGSSRLSSCSTCWHLVFKYHFSLQKCLDHTCQAALPCIWFLGWRAREIPILSVTILRKPFAWFCRHSNILVFFLILKHGFWDKLSLSAVSLSYNLTYFWNTCSVAPSHHTANILYHCPKERILWPFLNHHSPLLCNVGHQCPAPLCLKLSHLLAAFSFSYWLLKYCIILAILTLFSLLLLCLLWGFFSLYTP